MKRYWCVESVDRPQFVDLFRSTDSTHQLRLSSQCMYRQDISITTAITLLAIKIGNNIFNYILIDCLLLLCFSFFISLFLFDTSVSYEAPFLSIYRKLYMHLQLYVNTGKGAPDYICISLINNNVMLCEEDGQLRKKQESVQVEITWMSINQQRLSRIYRKVLLIIQIYQPTR